MRLGHRVAPSPLGNVKSVAVAGVCDHNRSYCSERWRSATIDGCTGEHANPHRAPGHLPSTMYGIAHCLIDRDGRVIGCNLPIGNGPAMAAAPAMASLLRELVAGAAPETLRERAELILRKIDRCAPREPGEDNE
jgi:hypothetical protein